MTKGFLYLSAASVYFACTNFQAIPPTTLCIIQMNDDPDPAAAALSLSLSCKPIKITQYGTYDVNGRGEEKCVCH